MTLRTNFFPMVMLLLVSLVGLSGCYIAPVRHLTSDVGLLEAGKSTEQDVLIFLGEPDERQDLGNGVEKWLYKEEIISFFEKAPLIGKHLGSPEYQQAVVTISKNIVTNVTYSSSDKDDSNWEHDYSWQEKKK